VGHISWSDLKMGTRVVSGALLQTFAFYS